MIASSQVRRPSIFDPRSSILDPRSSVFYLLSSILDYVNGEQREFRRNVVFDLSLQEYLVVARKSIRPRQKPQVLIDFSEVYFVGDQLRRGARAQTSNPFQSHVRGFPLSGRLDSDQRIIFQNLFGLFIEFRPVIRLFARLRIAVGD